MIFDSRFREPDRGNGLTAELSRLPGERGIKGPWRHGRDLQHDRNEEIELRVATPSGASDKVVRTIWTKRCGLQSVDGDLEPRRDWPQSKAVT
jgi:hypothetical protein